MLPHATISPPSDEKSYIKPCTHAYTHAHTHTHTHTHAYRYIPVRYMQAMGTFEYALQLYRSVLRFFFGASKEVKRIIYRTTLYVCHWLFLVIMLFKYMYNACMLRTIYFLYKLTSRHILGKKIYHLVQDDFKNE